MSQRKSKRRKSRVYRKFKIIIVLAVLLYGYYFIRTYMNQEISFREMNQNMASEQMKMKNIQKEVTELQEDFNIRETAEYVEKIARQELGMIRDSELIVVDKSDKSFDGLVE